MTWRGFHNPDDDIRPVREGLDRLARRLGTSGPDVLGQVVAKWPEVVGPEIARHATPTAIKKKSLVVEVDDKSWATQLRWITGKIVAALNSAVADSAVETIDIRSPRR